VTFLRTADAPDPRFLRDLERAAERHGRTGAGYGVLRAGMRDLGDDLLAEAIADNLSHMRSLCRFDDGSWAILVEPGGPDELNELAFRLSDRVHALARRNEFPPVRLVTIGTVSGSAPATARQMLDGADGAFRTVMRQLLAPKAAA